MRILLLLSALVAATAASSQPLPEFPALSDDLLASTSSLPDMPAMDAEPMGASEPAMLPDMMSLDEGSEPLPGSTFVLPEMPPMEQGPTMAAATNGGLPDLPPPSSAPKPPSSSPGAIPDLPDVEKPKEAPVLPGPAPAAAPAQLPALPGAPAAAPAGLPALPALPGEAPAKAADIQAPAQPALPALPGEQPSGQAVAPAPPDVKKADAAPAKPAAKKSFVYVPPPRHPNTIFGGLVTPKGRGEEMHLAWSSQEILNAMLGSGYELLKEVGEYNAGGWREFTFQHAKSKRKVSVYVKAAGKTKVWMRVGSSEPPAGVSLQEAKRARGDSEAALKILRKKFGGNLAPKKGTWEAPFDRPLS